MDPMTPEGRELMRAIDEMIRPEYSHQTLALAIAEPQLRDYLLGVWRRREGRGPARGRRAAMPKFRVETESRVKLYKQIYVAAATPERATALVEQRLEADDGEKWHDDLPTAELETLEEPEVIHVEENFSDVPPDLTDAEAGEAA